MEFMKLRTICFLLAFAFLGSACAPSKVKGNPPFVSISTLEMSANELSGRFDIRNINQVAMTIDTIEISIRVSSSELTQLSRALRLTIDPSAIEEVALGDLPDDRARPMLGELERGEVASLPFTLEGRVNTREDGWLPFRHEGHLYPVPGKPGQFRSASSRSREER